MERGTNQAVVANTDRFEIVLLPLLVPILALNRRAYIVYRGLLQREGSKGILQSGLIKQLIGDVALQTLLILRETLKTNLAQLSR